MLKLRESYIYHLWTLLYAVSMDSGVHHGLSAAGGQLFCQQKAKKSCRLPEIYRKMLMQFTYA